jgi:hypothetical protein
VDPQIFITYSSKDRKVAQTICSALEVRGLNCWISSRNVKPGQNFQEQIVKAIRAAKIMVLVFTDNAYNSNEIKKELALASQNNLTVIPVRIEDVTPNEAFSYEFATRQWIDLFEDWEKSIAHLVEIIAGALDESSSYPAKVNPAQAGNTESIRSHSQASRRDTDGTTGRSRYLIKVSVATLCASLVLFGAAWWLWSTNARNATVNIPQQVAGYPDANGQSGSRSAAEQSSAQIATRLPADELPGTYRIHGINPNGTAYGGQVMITPGGGDVYNFSWLVAGKQTYTGSGMLRGRIVSVDWGQPSPVIYRIDDDGTLRGTWANGTASEDLVPLR